MAASDYPLQLDIEYPEEPNRLTTFFRLILAIPVFIVGGMVSGSGFSGAVGEYSQDVAVGAGGALIFAPLLMILFRRKYPRWWFDWNLNLLRFGTRITAYVLLLQHEYPSTDEDQGVDLRLEYPNAETELTRWMPLVKWLLAVPHYLVLVPLTIGLFIAVIVAWFAILITGRMPRQLFDYMVGVLRYGSRVGAYATLLTTDVYPPFSIKE